MQFLDLNNVQFGLETPIKHLLPRVLFVRWTTLKSVLYKMDPFCFSYTIMKICWNLEPTERPTFSKISQMIERLLGEQPEQEQVS